MDDQQKYKVISRLQNDEKAKDIAEELGISYGVVLKLRRDFDQAKLNGSVDSLLNMDNVILHEVTDELANTTISSEQIGEFTEKLQGLDHLSATLQQTALNINKRANSLLLYAEHPSELEILTDILCKLQTSFINKNMTQVNVQNNYPDNSAPKYNQFLGDTPSD
jgi:hypothetical protein